MLNLNLFKMTKDKAVSIVEPKIGYPGERLLAEANRIVSDNATKDVKKGERLASIGFGKSKEAQEALKVKNDLVMGENLAEVIQYFTFNYPNNKFITDQEVKVICEKYGLVVGETLDYIGFMPEKNLRDIEKFKLKEEDNVYFMGYDNWRGGIRYHVISKDEYKAHTSPGHYNYLSGLSMNYVFKTNEMTICAPLKDFDMTGKELDGHKIKDIKLDDPIVLQTVYRNGIKGNLILTAWGDEASDPIVVNHKMN